MITILAQKATGNKPNPNKAMKVASNIGAKGQSAHRNTLVGNPVTPGAMANKPPA